jgi:hypothetical protein
LGIDLFGSATSPKLTAMRRSRSNQHDKVQMARAVVAQALGDAARRGGWSPRDKDSSDSLM